MELTGVIIAAAAAVAGIVGAIVAVQQARSASIDRKAADSARDESQRASAESARLAAIATAAFVRQAEAQERANELVEAALPAEEPDWEIQQIGGSRYVVVNKGTAPGLAAFVEGCGDAPEKIMPEETEPRDIEVGDNIAFLAVKAFGSPAKMRLTWTDPRTHRVQTAERFVR